MFSHLTAFWAEWLVDLHRVLAPGGLLVATFMGEGLSERIAGQPWDEEQVGMAVYQAGLSWDEGGPMVLLSPWWIREHWGRLFEIDTIFERDFGAGAPIFGPHDHGVVVARKTAMTAGPDDLRRPALGDKRETIALYHEAARLVTEVAALRPQVTALEQHAAYMDEVFGPAKYAALEAERDRLAKLLATTAATSASLPAPTVREAVRALAMALRAWLSRHRSKGSS